MGTEPLTQVGPGTLRPCKQFQPRLYCLVMFILRGMQYAFASKLNSTYCTTVGSLWTNELRAEKGFLLTCLILSPHMPALFMTSLIQANPDVFDTFGLCAGLVYDVTDTD